MGPNWLEGHEFHLDGGMGSDWMEAWVANGWRPGSHGSMGPSWMEGHEFHLNGGMGPSWMEGKVPAGWRHGPICRLPSFCRLRAL